MARQKGARTKVRPAKGQGGVRSKGQRTGTVVRAYLDSLERPRSGRRKLSPEQLETRFVELSERLEL